MITEAEIDSVRGVTVVDSDGDKVGKAGEVYLDDQTGQPTWLTVNTGLFGTSESFVPLESATFEGDELRVTFDKAKIKDAPRVAADGHLDLTEEDSLFEYYGISGGAQDGREPVGGGAVAPGTGSAQTTGAESSYATGTGRGDVDDVDRASGLAEQPVGERTEAASDRSRYAAEPGTPLAGDQQAGYGTSGPATDDAITRSEERLRAGTQTREAGRARLRKYVVTEQQTVTVPVSHEEVRLEREPITEATAGAATDGAAISEEEHEVVLHEEVPVVTTEARPVERVRLGTQTVTEEQQVEGTVRKEQIDLVGDDAPGAGTATTRRGDTEIGDERV